MQTTVETDVTVDAMHAVHALYWRIKDELCTNTYAPKRWKTAIKLDVDATLPRIIAAGVAAYEKANTRNWRLMGLIGRCTRDYSWGGSDVEKAALALTLDELGLLR